MTYTEQQQNAAKEYAEMRIKNWSLYPPFTASEVEEMIKAAYRQAFLAGVAFERPWTYCKNEMPTLHKLVDVAFCEFPEDFGVCKASHNGEDWIDDHGNLMLSREVYAWRECEDVNLPPLPIE